MEISLLILYCLEISFIGLRILIRYIMLGSIAHQIHGEAFYLTNNFTSRLTVYLWVNCWMMKRFQKCHRLWEIRILLRNEYMRTYTGQNCWSKPLGALPFDLGLMVALIDLCHTIVRLNGKNITLAILGTSCFRLP